MPSMRVLESGLWTKVRASFPGAIHRVEDKLSRGVPDCYHVHGWLELKVLQRVTIIKYDQTGVDWGIRGEQAAWHHQWHRDGGLSHILAAHLVRGTGWCFYLIEGRHALDAHQRRAVPFVFGRDTIPWDRLRLPINYVREAA